MSTTAEKRISVEAAANRINGFIFSEKDEQVLKHAVILINALAAAQILLKEGNQLISTITEGASLTAMNVALVDQRLRYYDFNKKISDAAELIINNKELAADTIRNFIRKRTGIWPRDHRVMLDQEYEKAYRSILEATNNSAYEEESKRVSAPNQYTEPILKKLGGNEGLRVSVAEMVSLLSYYSEHRSEHSAQNAEYLEFVYDWLDKPESETIGTINMSQINTAREVILTSYALAFGLARFTEAVSKALKPCRKAVELLSEVFNESAQPQIKPRTD
jgi:hypothetical protein